MTGNYSRSGCVKAYHEAQGRKLFGAKCIFALFVIAALILHPITGQAENSPTLEERLSRMEQEVRHLKDRNAGLEQEVEQLRMQLDATTEAAGNALEEVASDEAQKPPMDISYNKGLHIVSPDNTFKMKMGGRVTTRFTALDSGHPSSNEFAVERARLYANVTLLDHYDLRIQTELSKDAKLKDGYINIHHIPWAQLKIGQFKPPYTWENLQSHKYIDFADRSIAVNNMRGPSRDIGMMLHGKLLDNRLAYQLAVLNGSGENTGDDNDAKDVAGRLTLDPFKGSENELFAKVHLGISGTVGNQDKDYSSSSFKTIGGTKFVDFAANTLHTGDRIRIGTEAGWALGPASVKAEWLHMRLDDFELAPLKEDVDFDAWYISGSYLLTGEEKGWGRLSPERPFDPSQKSWGAWELAARYSLFDGDSDIFKLGMAAGTDKAEAFTVGLNWYLNDYMRMIFDYEHTEFDEDITVSGESLDDEDAFMVRCQLEF